MGQSLKILRALVAAVLVLGAAHLSAHDVVVEQTVEISVEPRPGALLVRLHVPASIASDPGLAGLLAAGDSAALTSRLTVVAADIARSLDVEQGAAARPTPAITARAGADRASIDVELQYPRDETGRVSALLNTFRSPSGIVRTSVRYQRPGGDADVLSLTGAPERVTFDPPASAVLSQFARRGVRALLDGGDYLLFIVCLLLPLRQWRIAVRLGASMAIAQAVAIAVTAILPQALTPWLPGIAIVAASLIAIGALQNVAGARFRWVLPLAIVFGALNGSAFGATASASRQFAGAHHALAIIAFGAVVLIGELWLGALAWALRLWLDERGFPERIVVFIGSAGIAHSAIHRVMERAQTGFSDPDRILWWLVACWIAAILIAAAGNAAAGAAEGTAA